MIDRGFQLAYKVAYRMMRVYWKVAHPNTHGALVAVWHRGQILLVKNSYVPYWSLPGGYVHAGETAVQAALRELKEEVGLEASASDLKLSVDVQHDWEGKRDHVEIFELEAEHAPRIDIDNREVVAAELFTPERARALELFPPIREALDRHARS